MALQCLSMDLPLVSLASMLRYDLQDNVSVVP